MNEGTVQERLHAEAARTARQSLGSYVGISIPAGAAVTERLLSYVLDELRAIRVLLAAQTLAPLPCVTAGPAVQEARREVPQPFEGRALAAAGRIAATAEQVVPNPAPVKAPRRRKAGGQA